MNDLKGLSEARKLLETRITGPIDVRREKIPASESGRGTTAWSEVHVPVTGERSQSQIAHCCDDEDADAIAFLLENWRWILPPDHQSGASDSPRDVIAACVIASWDRVTDHNWAERFLRNCRDRNQVGDCTKQACALEEADRILLALRSSGYRLMSAERDI